VNTPLTQDEFDFISLLTPGASPMPTATALRLAGGLAAYLAPRIAADAALPKILPMVRDVSRNNFGTKKQQIASRIRYAMRGKVAMDADLSDLMDLLDALEEIGEGENLEAEGQDRRRGRAGDTDPNGFGNGGFETNNEYGNGGWATGRGEGPASLYDNCPPDVTDPDQWRANHPPSRDQEEQYWREADEEERRRNGIANSTRSEAIDARIRANADRRRKAADNRKAVIDKMRGVIRDALSARDTEVEGHNVNVSQSSALEPGYERIDTRSTGQDRRRIAGDAASTPRQRMFANMSRITNTGVAFCPTPATGVPSTGSGATSPSFAARFPNASKIKI
jgi:hypothetical protein